MRPKPKLRTWTPDAIEQLTALWRAGHSAGQIAKRLSVSRSACCAKLQRLGLCRAHKPPTAKPKIVAVPKHPAPIEPPPVAAPALVDPLHRPVPPRQLRPHYSKAELRAMLAAAVANTAPR
jgi:GcrA cell cycle regulator